MIVGRKPLLSDADAESLYRDYCAWLEARERFSPSVLAKKYGVTKQTVRRYGNRFHKSRRAA